MDVSNPILVGDRTSLWEMNTEMNFRKRQDFALLKQIVEDGGRVEAPLMTGNARTEPSKSDVQNLISEVAQPVRPGPVELTVGRIDEKMGIDPPHRSFRPPTRMREMLQYLLARDPLYYGPISERVMCTGTKEGFQNRLEMWFKVKPISSESILKAEGLNAQDILKERLPIDSDSLTTWNGNYRDLLSDIKITKNSSSGPPYFKPKMEVWDKIWKDLEELLEAADGDFDQYMAERPWLMAAECKNKQDRYKVSELKSKTRPYWSINSSMQFLFSFLAQNFTSTLKTFDQQEGCWNGYGFSLAHGGGEKIRRWAMNTKRGEKKLAIYGDDVMLVFRDKEGILWNVMPDFSQQDASVDKDTVLHTIAYICTCFEKKWGPNPFWQNIALLWAKMAINSKFWIDGIQMYNKPHASLRTGVVGTTIFDTVKSIFAYEVLLHKRVNLMDQKAVIKEMKRMGLTIKEGTWNPTPVNEEQDAGQTLFQSKWLGALLVFVEGKYMTEPIPFLPEDDLVSLIGNPRVIVSAKSTRTTVQRYLFDSARGYMVTGAFHHPNLWNAMCDIVNNTSNEVIAMGVQSNNGRGEAPELVHLVGEDFQWPSSDGVPDPNFCKNVFLSSDNKLPERWLDIFPALTNQLKEYRKDNKKKMMPVKVREDNSWYSQTKEDELKMLTSDVTSPPYSEVMERETALMKKFKEKKHVKYVKPETVEVKKNKISNVIDEYLAEFELDWAVVIFSNYGTRFVYETLLEQGWHLHPGRIMKREPYDGPLQAREVKGLANVVTNEIKRQPKTPALPIPCTDILVTASEYLGPESQDKISRVSSAFVSIGAPLRARNCVITQGPPVVVQHVVQTPDRSFERTRIASSGKLAREELFSDLLREMTEIQQRIQEEKKQNKHGEKKKSKQQESSEADNNDHNDEGLGACGTDASEDRSSPCDYGSPEEE